MQTIGCPACGNPLAESSGYCARCGETVISSETLSSLIETALAQRVSHTDIPITPVIAENTIVPQLVEAGTGYAHQPPGVANVVKEPGANESTIRLPGRITGQRKAATAQSEQNAADSKGTPQEPGEAETTLQLSGRATRQRAASPDSAEAESTVQLPHRAIRRQSEKARGLSTPTLKLHFAQAGARARLERDLLIPFDETVHDEQDDDEVMQHHETWQKVVEHKTTHSIPIVSVAPAPGKKALSGFSELLRRHTVVSFFWLTTLVLIALLLSGAFGLAVSFGRTVKEPVPNPPPALLASPTTVALGGFVTLHGTHFTPGGNVTLSRDQGIALVDTGNESTIQADAHGFFSDTFVADPDWLSGLHTLYATDVHSHKQALVPIDVTGPNVLQGPPHLLLSSYSLNLGSGDEITNARTLLALANAGGGLATWQASTSQSWLQITPQSGSVASGKHISVIVAADRAALAPGSYQANIVFTSNTGQITLPVKITVTALQPSHEAIMQLSTATLAFEGSARGNSPGAQTITISNPGVQPLTWGKSVNGSGWLWVAPPDGTIPAGGQQQVTIGVTTDGLASGIYKGVVSFSNQGSQPAQGSPQSINVSLTVTPPCTLTLSTDSQSFHGTHNGSNPAGKSLSIGVADGCKISQHWTATSSASWLNVSSSRGLTPSTIRVSTSTGGLAPGTYHGLITFTNILGSKMLSVTLSVTPVPCSVSGPSTLDLQGTAGQSDPVTQDVTIQAAGDCAHSLDWTTSVDSSSWLSASSSGAFTSSDTVNIRANLLSLSAGPHYGTVTVTVVDSVTNQTVGTVAISVTLNAQPPAPPATPCTLQYPSSSTLSFTASQGNNPDTPTASFTISVLGSCSGDVTISPDVDSAGSGWLSVSGPVTIASGSTATFTVTVDSSAQATDTYTSIITLTASDGIDGSPHSVTVTLTVQ